ncbi:MAG: glycosyltransferase family 2 protein [Spirochaetes bacterium]|nr:glycosyltransferase family 2 protein [Spirochaetota bacterium]
MNIIQRIKFPLTKELFNLYFKCNDDVLKKNENCLERIILQKSEKLSLNTYFNSYYVKYYTKYTGISSSFYLLNLEGDFKVNVYKEFYNNGKKIIFVDEYKNCKKENAVKLLLTHSNVNKEELGRIYIEIECLSKKGMFFGGHIATENRKKRDVFLGIIICTYKKEDFIKKIISIILNDIDLVENKNFKIYIIDNGNTLNNNEFNNERINIFFNKNYGGSGGFARGLIEASKNKEITHYLFMDDDIILESEAIFRLFTLYEYCIIEMAIAGGMIDLGKKNQLCEAGAEYGINMKRLKRTFGTHPYKYKYDLIKESNLNDFLEEDNINYGAFCFFSFSREILKKIGLPMPYFICGDDIEYGLRINKLYGDKILFFPSISIWHKSFEDCSPEKKCYYFVRNSLITNTIYDYSTFLKTIIDSIFKIIPNILFIKLYIKAFEDFFKGPAFLKKIEPDKLHLDITNISNKLSEKSKSKTLKLLLIFINLFLILKWIKIILMIGVKWKVIKKEWKESHNEFTSYKFWEKYLQL